MSKETSSNPSLKSLEKDCKSMTLDTRTHILIVTSPYPAATLATAILSRVLMRSGGRFQITFGQPVMSIDTLNELRTKYETSTVFMIGIDIFGSKRVKKGRSYPVLIGGTSESEQLASITLGTDSTMTSAAYVLAKSQMELDSYDLQLAAAGALVQDSMNESKRGASMDIIKLAEKEGLIEERKGFRLFGIGMLPLDEALLYSTHPYLHTLSGNQKACDELLSKSEIPVSKLRSPLSSLSSSEAQRLTSHLITQLDPEIIPQLLGKDYIFMQERETSPLRYASGIEIAATTAWVRHELGASMSVWLGDRGRALRGLIDTHMSHHKDVVSAIQRLERGLVSESTPSATIVKILGSKTEILPDVGRIALSNRLVGSDRPVVLDNEESYTIIWPSSELTIKQVLHGLLRKGILPVATSPQSITIAGPSEMKETSLQMITALTAAGG
jgi:hypothetical protein